MVNTIFNMCLVLGAYFGFLAFFFLIAILKLKYTRRAHTKNDTNLA
jgi:hypothetical protein